MEPTVMELASQAEAWREFLYYKQDKQHLSAGEEAKLRRFVDSAAYLPLCRAWQEGRFPSRCPRKSVVSKAGTGKKRVVYSFEGDEGIFLKFLAFQLYRYDCFFSDNCYAFRRNCGVRDAMKRLLAHRRIGQGWCLKVDVSNYFNSIDVEILLDKLSFVREDEPALYELFRRILLNRTVLYRGQLIEEAHGAMAGIPVAPFFANIYLGDTDAFFEKEKVPYFRYSDDILLFADSREELERRQEQLYAQLQGLGLSVNPDKVKVAAPGEYWDFLGFGYRGGGLDLSDNTIRKTKGRIRRKAEALRRWQRKKGLTADKAAIGLIHAMNRKFYGSSADEEPEDEFTWSRWFFGSLTTDRGLKEIDAYLQEYIRYAVTGRHYKGNYRIPYEQLKAWGYRSLVHEFWEGRNVDAGKEHGNGQRVLNAGREPGNGQRVLGT